ncbi:uncharacterized protein MELLADRAFT_84649 [Melampsora larici-populina 98AG31]|uniref:Uncharacterized protein n=1 Tax=Melampsora larici-populina (strain 98AG31 / pathotype 3-4-7) TaxID=747676 RepID=F4RG13_MELLP|nr:uncharacterized protein MELLADRAFT_84649 [Melampsora larici-populina 98AG31]EGG08471.1 hypothetical protein MELLADRAFT_84649 [Melampsora larici-populina 98AG31]
MGPVSKWKKWGSPKSEAEITDLFVRYTKQEIDSTPWSDTPLLEESDLISDTILKMNSKGYWMISPQPACDEIINLLGLDQ